ncbi:MAG: chorismate synthase [Rectinemataceae bacterium]
MNSFGRNFRVELFGESHGPAVGVVIDGCPPGIRLAPEDMEPDLARRRAGATGTTPRREADRPEFLSGIHEGRTTGAPLCVIFRNGDTKPTDYAAFASMPRPGHADMTARIKFGGFNDPRGSGHFSGRVTVGLVAAGAVAKKIMPGLRFDTEILSAGGSADIPSAIAAAIADADSVGALVEIRVDGMPAGLGEPFFDSVESLVSHALFSVPGVRGVEFGDGFRAASMRGSEHNDPIIDSDGHTSANGSGGVNGGISNGNRLVVRVAVKPASTIARAQATFDFASGLMGTLAAEGRHDACIALRAAVVLEAACAIALADLYRSDPRFASKE